MAAFTAAWDGPPHILVNNAGVMACPQAHTPQGWELQVAALLWRISAETLAG